MKGAKRYLTCETVKEFLGEQTREPKDFIWQTLLFFRIHRELLELNDYRRLYNESLELWINMADGTQGFSYDKDELEDIEFMADLFVRQSLLLSGRLTREQVDAFLEYRRLAWRSL